MQFTREEVRLHLKELGFENASEAQIDDFVRDLRRLIKHEEKRAAGIHFTHLKGPVAI
jgi:hypothetical protein